MVFPTFLNLSLNLAIRSSWSEPLCTYDLRYIVHANKKIEEVLKIFIYLIGGPNGKELACRCRRLKRCGFDPWIRKVPGEENGNPLQYSCLENPMDRGAWWVTGHRVTQSWTQLKRWSIPKSDWSYSLQPKMEKLYTVSKNKTGSWLLLRSWICYCKIQT